MAATPACDTPIHSRRRVVFYHHHYMVIRSSEPECSLIADLSRLYYYYYSLAIAGCALKIYYIDN